jgi:hypothetical protein
MTDQHPLTDDIIRYDKKLGCHDLGTWIYTENDLRAAADWQLDQVKEEIKRKLILWRKAGYVFAADACEDFFEEVMQELRPQQQENNQ